uniref:Large ribosomal subunit protein bL17m n=1 Tax=Maconellicoccus hirsutus TaxID=177089 RepID=A2I450_MACHI|nr:putative mitochondrial ribosomal protein L17 [Maconellicoccus hirsutus]
MNQADITHLISKLRIKVAPTARKLKNPAGPEGRLNKLRKIVNALVKYERLELQYPRADEARGYAERLISEAIRHGDSHKPTMEMASFWLEEKQLVHKLFKVLAPRFKDYQVAYTALYKAPKKYPDELLSYSILELRGNPFPPLIFDGSRNKNVIHNVLLEEARREYRKEKYAEIAAKVLSSENQQNQSGNVKNKEPNVISKAAQEISESEQLLKFSTEEKQNEQEIDQSSSDINKPLPVV